MIVSMTGFGASKSVFEVAGQIWELGLELKTLNSRHLDLSIRSPKNLIQFDGAISKILRSRLRRGRVEVSYFIRVLEGASKSLVINAKQAKLLYQGLEKVRKSLKIKKPVEFSDLLKFPDWYQFEEVESQSDLLWKELENNLNQAMASLMQTRQREGADLEKILRGHLKVLKDLHSGFTRDLPKALGEYRQRCKERVEELLETEKIDAQRLEQEITLFVGRSDFQEEVDRIRHHLETFEKLMDSPDEVCRRLEFLVQELQREANTMGSKCPDAAMTMRIIEFKAVIERIREQLQNGE